MSRRKRSGDQKRREKITKYSTLFIAAIMIFSVVGYMWMGPEETGDAVEIDGNIFEKTINGWQMKTPVGKVPFYNLPNDFASVELGDEIIEQLSMSAYAFVSVNPQEMETENLKPVASIAYSMVEVFNEKLEIYSPMPSLTSEHPDYENISLVSCANATQYTPVIVFGLSNETLVESNNNCISLTGKSPFDLARIKDKIIYEIVVNKYGTEE